MLISHKYKFIIINIQKTGTTSLRRTLMPLNIVDVAGISAPISSNVKFHHHGTIKDAISSFKEEGWNIKEYFKYSIVRNPWDRYFSFFAYSKNKLNFYKETDIKLNTNLKRQKEYIYNLLTTKQTLKL